MSAGNFSKYQAAMWSRFNRVAQTLGLVVLGGIMVSSVWAADPVVSTPAGFHRIDLLGNSDTRVSFPFTRPEAAAGRVESISDNVVTLKGSPGWTANQFAYAGDPQPNAYYLQIRSGTKEGFYYPITGNGAGTLTLSLGGDTLTGLNAGDRVAVIPYWTLATVFPGGQGVHESLSEFVRKTEVFIPNLTGIGVNLSPTKTYYFLEGHWYLYPLTDVKDDDVLLPDAYFIVRHNVGITTTLTIRGGVAMTKWVMPLRVNTNKKQDNVVALPRPSTVTLNSSGLIESGAFRPSGNEFVRIDELFVFDNNKTGKNKSASATYYYLIDHWARYPDTTDAGNDPVFAPGTGVIIRKGTGVGNPIWINQPPY
jgi:uncharacterized protein (TIGR02597 family)